MDVRHVHDTIGREIQRRIGVVAAAEQRSTQVTQQSARRDSGLEAAAHIRESRRGNNRVRHPWRQRPLSSVVTGDDRGIFEPESSRVIPRIRCKRHPKSKTVPAAAEHSDRIDDAWMRTFAGPVIGRDGAEFTMWKAQASVHSSDAYNV